LKIHQNTRVLLTGAGGMLGDAFYSTFSNKVNLLATDINLNEKWLNYLDVRDYSEYRKQACDFKPDIIVHLAALTDLEFCEMNQDKAYETNTLAVENAVCIANELESTLVYISTAGIFNGVKDLYSDWEKPDPINIYGSSKYMGELHVLNNAHKYFVCRAGWMMGGGPKKDKKFVNKIIIQINNGAKNLNIVNDKMGTPTYTYGFANNVYKLLKTPYYGVYNMVCPGLTSRYDVALELLKILNKTDEITITKVSSDYFAEEYFANRPRSEILINTKLELRKLNIMPPWETSLKQYLENYFPEL
jgi:dTDP-4-dehydrorhamnose reductase